MNYATAPVTVGPLATHGAADSHFAASDDDSRSESITLLQVVFAARAARIAKTIAHAADGFD